MHTSAHHTSPLSSHHPIHTYVGLASQRARSPSAPSARSPQHVRLGHASCILLWLLPCRNCRCASPGSAQESAEEGQTTQAYKGHDGQDAISLSVWRVPSGVRSMILLSLKKNRFKRRNPLLRLTCHARQRAKSLVKERCGRPGGGPGCVQHPAARLKTSFPTGRAEVLLHSALCGSL